MSPQDIAKDAIRIATTAGLSKDVIDLLKEKVALLADKISTLEQEKSILQTEIANLKKKVAEREQELDRHRPKPGRLEEEAEKFLKFLFDHRRPAHLGRIASGIGLPLGIAEYHRDKLWDLEMISEGRPWEGYELMPKGREYVVKHLLPKNNQLET